jgi:F0F1-type ATP synthase delta subunit
MDQLPTIDECSTWILEHCQTILSYIEKGNFDIIKDIAQTTYDSTKILIDALDISKKDKTKLFNKLDRYSKFKQNNNMLKLLVKSSKFFMMPFR